MIVCPCCGQEGETDVVRTEAYGEVHRCPECGDEFVLTPDGELITFGDL